MWEPIVKHAAIAPRNELPRFYERLNRGADMDQLESVTNARRTALNAYAALEPRGTERAAVAQSLFGVPASRRWLPMLDELAQNVLPARNAQ